jgi:hypothetical protein
VVYHKKKSKVSKIKYIVAAIVHAFMHTKKKMPIKLSLNPSDCPYRHLAIHMHTSAAKLLVRRL